ncbi:mesothelin [Pelodytes ibericus]
MYILACPHLTACPSNGNDKQLTIGDLGFSCEDRPEQWRGILIDSDEIDLEPSLTASDSPSPYLPGLWVEIAICNQTVQPTCWLLVTLSSAGECNATVVNLNVTEACANAKGLNVLDLCSLTFKDYACLSPADLSNLPDNILVTLPDCKRNDTSGPDLAALFFSKLDSNKAKVVLSSLNAKISQLTPGWAALFLGGIQSLVTQALNISSSVSQSLPGSVQPFLPFVNASIIECLQSQNATCDRFQTLVHDLSLQFNNMSVPKRNEMYLAIKSFLTAQKNLTGSACAVNVNTTTWIKQNLGNFSQIANLEALAALNAKFSALEALPVLTLQQLANLSVDSALVNISVPTPGLIVGALQNKSDVYSFLTFLSTAVAAKNQSSLPLALSQALLNKTLQFFVPNVTSYNSTEWSLLLQNQLASVLPDITAGQLNVIPQNISCNVFQAVIKNLNVQFPKLDLAKRQEVYNSLIKPHLMQKDSACATNVNSSTWVQQNLGNFSQLADLKDLVAFNANFSALEALSVLTIPQIASFSLGMNAVNNLMASGLVVGALQNKSDVFTFLASLNAAVFLNNQSFISSALSQALFNKTFQVLGSNVTSFNSSDWSQLLQDQLGPVLPGITADQLSLIPQNISCASYHAIINVFNTQFPTMNPASQAQVYQTFIKPYLTQKDNTIVCFNQSEANSSAWFVTNIASFLTYTNEQDLGLFANVTMQQGFAKDLSCVQLASQLNFPTDTAIYFTSLLTTGTNSNLTSIPGKFLCYLSPSALKKLNSNEAISLSKRINQQCRASSSGQASRAPTNEELQVAVSLVSKLETISSDTLSNLGPSAVGLSQSQINAISDKDLGASVPTLGNVTGWNKGQSRVIMDKLLQSGYQIKSLESLGSLVSGLPSKNLEALDPTLVLNSLQSPQFVSQISNANPILKNTFVRKILAVETTPTNIVKNVPSDLARYIPKSSLSFISEKPNVQDLNGKLWTSDQAAMFFDQVVASGTNATNLSASVLQGFTCGSPSKINIMQLKELAKAMRTQAASLEEGQLNCLARQITKNGIPTDLDTYPKEMLMFISPLNYSGGANCKGYYTNVGLSNISILQKGSKLRSSLLTQALACMNVTNASLTNDNVMVLGQLVCDLNASYIENATDSLLTQLSQCKSFTADQETAIQNVIARGNSQFGSPSKWSKATLKSLGSLNGILSKSILTKVPTSALTSWVKESADSSSLTRNQLVSIVKNLYPLRTRRAVACPSGMEITADNVQNSLNPLLYTADQLDACLNNSILAAYLLDLSNQPFTNEQLAVFKNKLDQLYPGGYPESVIPNLGAIAFLCGEQDVGKWNITSVDTLYSMLASGPPDNLAKIYITKYIASAGVINGSAVNAIGSSYICLLNSTQLDVISSTAISEAQTLQISLCNQTVKDALYIKAKASYQSMLNQSTYYTLMQPYLGGAPAADLKTLAAKNISMDIGTFTNLNPSSVNNLTVNDVIGLLGVNVADLKAQETNAVISSWVKIQTQSDLDKLGLGIQGGIREVSVTTTQTLKIQLSSVRTLSSVQVQVGLTIGTSSANQRGRLVYLGNLQGTIDISGQFILFHGQVANRQPAQRKTLDF